jgi:hypothetical protein
MVGFMNRQQVDSRLEQAVAEPLERRPQRRLVALDRAFEDLEADAMPRCASTIR